MICRRIRQDDLLCPENNLYGKCSLFAGKPVYLQIDSNIKYV
jgi:hypothetical protein